MDFLVDKILDLEELMLQNVNISTEVKLIHEAANIKLLNPGQLMEKYTVSLPLGSKETFQMFDEKLKIDQSFRKDIVS